MLLEVKVYAIGGESLCYCNYLKYNGKQISNNRGIKGLLDVLNEKWSEERYPPWLGFRKGLSEHVTAHFLVGEQGESRKSSGSSALHSRRCIA